MKRRICIALHLSVKGGSALGVLITEKCHVPCGDRKNVRPNPGTGESFMSLSIGKPRPSAADTALQGLWGGALQAVPRPLQRKTEIAAFEKQYPRSALVPPAYPRFNHVRRGDR
jgi:hypothetical protein